MSYVRLCFFLLILFSTLVASAHVRMNSPLGRTGTSDDAKFNQPDPVALTVPDAPGPCAGYTTPMATRLQYVTGQTINMNFTETINHPGRFIVQFSPVGNSGFWDPANQLANIADTQSGGVRNIPITLPTTACDNCMLRVLQQMDDQPGEYYVHCFDIKLAATATSSTNKQPTAEMAGCGLIATTPNKKPPYYLYALILIPMLAYAILKIRARDANSG